MIKVEKEKCVGCGVCEQVCPSSAIKVVDKKAAVNDNCVHCLTCVKYCKPGALAEDAVAEDALLCRSCGVGCRIPGVMWGVLMRFLNVIVGLVFFRHFIIQKNTYVPA